MKNKDYEQLYYDQVYENRQLKNKIEDMNRCRTKRNIDLQKYLLLQIKRNKTQNK